MIRRLTHSLVEATRHITDIAVKQVSQAVLVRQNAYLAKAPLTDRVKKPLRAQPLESPKLFADKMVEALDLDREECKAQPAKQPQNKSSYSGGRQQSSKTGGNNSNSSKQEQSKGSGNNSNNNNSKKGGYRNRSSSRVQLQPGFFLQVFQRRPWEALGACPPPLLPCNRWHHSTYCDLFLT